MTNEDLPERTPVTTGSSQPTQAESQLDTYSDLPSMPDQIKILVIGAFNSGKSTLIQNITDDSFSADELGTTVSLDFGTLNVDGWNILLFGTPGHDRFDFIREILAQNLKGILLMIDSLYPETFWKALDYIREVNSYIEESMGFVPPFVICANKQDIDGALTPEEVKEEISYELLEDVPVIGVTALTGEGVMDAIRALLAILHDEDIIPKTPDQLASSSDI